MDKPNSTKPTLSKTNQSSIEHLRIYQLARSLEDKLYEYAKTLPGEQFYPLGNDLRRSSAAAAHYIAETHKRYSYSVKIESLHAARTAAEEAIRHLETFKLASKEDPTDIIEDYNALIRQSWGLIKYLKNKQTQTSFQEQSRASDELVAARG